MGHWASLLLNDDDYYISYVGMLNQTRIGVGSVTFHRKGHMRGQHVFRMSKSRNLSTFLFSIIILGNSASHFLEMIMLSS